MALHSTGMRIAARHCPRALDFHETRAPRWDRLGFETGIAAHAVLEAVGRATEDAGRTLEPEEVAATGDAVVAGLIVEGREYDGDPEPPLQPDHVFRGRELAESWLLAYPLEPCGARYEVGLAVNPRWEPVPYTSPDAWLACIVDVVAVEDRIDEEGETRVLRVADAKTSWQADAGELDTLQRRIQAVLAHCCLPEAGAADVLRLEVASIRRWTTYSEEIFLHHGGLAKLERWRREIDIVANELGALALNGARPARPGPGCLGCPWIHKCGDAQLYFGREGIPDDPVERARAYCVAIGMVDHWQPMIKEAARGGALVTHLGPPMERVGWRQQPSTRIKPNAHQVLAELWAEHAGVKESAGALSSLLAALGGVTVTEVKSVLKTIFPGAENADARRGYELALTEPYQRRSWGAWKEEE